MVYDLKMCIVQWPCWERFYEVMRRNFNEYWYEDVEFYKRDDLRICYEDFERHAGKWFRAACVKVHFDQRVGEEDSTEVYE